MSSTALLNGGKKRLHSAFEIVDSAAILRDSKRQRFGPLVIEEMNDEVPPKDSGKIDSAVQKESLDSRSSTSSPSSSSNSMDSSDLDDSQSSDTLTQTDFPVSAPSSTNSARSSINSTSSSNSSSESDSDSDSDSNSDVESSSSSSSSEDSSSSLHAIDPLPTILPSTIPPVTAPPGVVSLSSLSTTLEARLASLLPQLAAANQALETERSQGRLGERNIEKVEEEEEEYIEMVSWDQPCMINATTLN